jgi:dTDP-glucose 4,6-dehydratase
VDDLIEGITRLLYSDVHEPVNIGNPTETSILEFAEVINRMVVNPAGVVYQPEGRVGSDPQRRRPDISRARQVLGWEPQVSLEQGLLKTIPYFKQKLGLA